MNKTIMLAIFFYLFSSWYSSSALLAECLHLKDNTVIIGEITERSDDIITIQNEYGIQHINKSEVLNAYQDYNEYKDHINGKRWKRHFFDFSLIMGGTFAYIYYGINVGGLIGLSVGYMFGVTKYFAVGPGLSGFISIYYRHDSIVTGVETFGIGAFMVHHVIGDLKDKQIAFLFDIGGGFGFGVKIGLYIKGFFFKIGYYNLVAYNHITLDLGYKLKWNRKIKFIKL